jgi:5-methylthioadenosine/S-adenosylhomocysteine deaminase
MSMILKNGMILEEDLSFKDRDLHIDGDRITDFVQGEVEDLDGMIVMPGLINTHTHAAMTLFRGIAEDVNLEEWLFKYIFPREDKLSEEDVYVGSLVGFMEMIKNGITTFVDMYFFEDAIAQAAKDLGMRGIVARGLADTDGHGDRKLLLAENFIKKHFNDPMIKGGFGPHALYTCSNDYFKEIVRTSKDYDLPLTFHLFEAPNERDEFKKRTGIDAFDFLDSIDAFDEKTIIAHGTHLNRNELKILSERGSTLSYNPISNAKLGNGIAPIRTAMEVGVNVTLGTDSAASNNSLNIFNEMKFGIMLQRAKAENPVIMKSSEVIRMATVNARKALPFDVGALNSGMLADLIVIDPNRLSTLPKKNFLSHLLYAFDTSAIVKVMIGGKWVYDENFLTVDARKVMDDFEKTVNKIDLSI